VSYNQFAYAADFSYARVNFLNSTNLQVEFYQSATNDLLDSSVLYKAHDVDFVVQ
jgi:acid phosphatase type 7